MPEIKIRNIQKSTVEKLNEIAISKKCSREELLREILNEYILLQKNLEVYKIEKKYENLMLKTLLVLEENTKLFKKILLLIS